MIEMTLPDNTNIRINFSFPDKHKPIDEQKYTIAKLSRKIISPDDPKDYLWEVTDTTIAKCNNMIIEGRNYGDKFSKYKGRKEAFKRLLKNNFDCNIRKELWEKFFIEFGYGH